MDTNLDSKNKMLDRISSHIPPLFIFGMRIEVYLYYFNTENPDYSVSAHAHNWYEISRPMRGRARYKLDDEPGSIEPEHDEMVILPACSAHEWKAVEVPLWITSFQVGMKAVEPSGADFIRLFNEKIISQKYRFPVTDQLKDLDDTVWEEADRPVSYALSVTKLRFHIRLFLLYLFEDCFSDVIKVIESKYELEYGSQEDEYDLPKSIEAFVKTNVTRSLQLQDVASHFHFSARHLNRVFSARYGCPIGTFIQDVKIESACGFLKGTSRSIKDIAFSLGYKDVGYFSRHFSRRKGMTPSDFRQKETLPKPLM